MNNFELTKDQQIAFDLILKNDKFILKGFSGTGKSTLINYFCEYMKNIKSDKNIVKLASTNKAVSVIDGDMTVYVYLGLSLKRVGGEEIIKQNPRNIKAEQGDIVFFDEVSLANQKLLDYLFEAQDKYDLKIVLTGWKYQLPPVGADISPAWKLDWPTYELTEIVRQNKGNPIIQLGNDIKDGKYINFRNYVDNKHIFMGYTNEMRDFCLNNSNPDPVVIISHRNIVVDKANIWLRNLLLDNPKEQYLIGEPLYIRSSSLTQLHKLEDFVKISKISDKYIFGKEKILCYDIEVKSDKGTEELRIPCDIDEQIKIDQIKKKMSKDAKVDKSLWSDFWEFSDNFSKVKNRFAMTCFRSQGSTFSNVVVNVNDVYTKNLMYVACTRPKSKLFILKK